jgi:hypothetical protein
MKMLSTVVAHAHFGAAVLGNAQQVALEVAGVDHGGSVGDQGRIGRKGRAVRREGDDRASRGGSEEGDRSHILEFLKKNCPRAEARGQRV